jgi:3'-phosphoadenosine 5'-phosphosulfate sulfotransferase (PAPS reductase)/FAD synthetase
METALFSVILSTLVRNLPIVVIFAIGIILIISYALTKYLKSSYVPIRMYEQDKQSEFKIIEQYKDDLNKKADLTHEELNREINRINNDLMKYVLQDEFKEFKDKVEEKMDNLNDKIDALPDKINESEQRIIDIFLKMFTGNK